MRKWKLLIGKFWAEKVYSWLFYCMAVFRKYPMSNFGSILNQVVFILMGNNLVINCYNLIFFLTKMTKISCRYFYRILRKTRNSHTSGLWEWLPIHWLSLQRNRDLKTIPSPWCFTNPTLIIRQVCKEVYRHQLHAQTGFHRVQLLKTSALYLPTLYVTRCCFLV